MKEDWSLEGSARRMGRREALKLLAVGGVTLAGVKGSTSAAAATGAFDWKKYAGQTIRVLVPVQPIFSFIQPLIPEERKPARRWRKPSPTGPMSRIRSQAHYWPTTATSPTRGA